jgi:DNA processing protein
VGNRNASAAGLAFTSTLATELAHAGFSITSGLARGIDTAAHAGALAAQKPTIAVVGGGVDVIYPEENRALHASITAAGCVVSEAPLGAVPTPSLFPRRNRIIAGLSYGVVVTEASRHSGSLITSTCAGEYGREVFAVPGSPSDTRAAGPNHLIKQGATMIESAQDILSILQPQLAFSPQPHTRYTRETHINTTPLALFDEPIAPEPALLSSAVEISPSAAPAERLYHLLGSAPVAVDELIRKSNLPETEVLIALTELDLEGRLTRHANGFLSRA